MRLITKAGLCLALAAACLGAAPVPAAATRALEILERSIRADGRVTYAGTAEFRRYEGKRVAGTHVQRVTNGGGNRQRMEVVAPPEEAGRLIVSNGRVEWEYRPRARVAQRRELLPPEEIQRHKLSALRLVADTLFPVYLGTETVAGRACHVIAVKPPDGRRTSKKVWIDAEHFVELRWARYGPRGEPLITWSITEVDFAPPVPANAFEFSPPPGVPVRAMPRAPRMPLPEAERRLGFRAVLPAYLPPGFVLHRDHVGVTEFRGRQALWMQFVNGVDTFSIFQSPALSAPPAELHRAVHWDAQGFSFLLVGNLPPQEKDKIRASMR